MLRGIVSSWLRLAGSAASAGAVVAVCWLAATPAARAQATDTSKPPAGAGQPPAAQPPAPQPTPAGKPNPNRSIFDDDYPETKLPPPPVKPPPATPAGTPARVGTAPPAGGPATRPAADKPPADPAVPGPGLVAEAFQGARFDKPAETRVLKAVNVTLRASGAPPGGAAV